MSDPNQDALLQTFGPWNKGEIKGAARQGADFARLGGGFGNADTDSMKHTFGRIAQNFEHTPQGLQALVNDAEFKQLFPKATLDKDWIDFGGQIDPHTGTAVGKVDVLHAYDPNMGAGNNKNWQWLTEQEALGNAGAPAATKAPMVSGQSDLMAQILASLQAQQETPIDPQMALLQALR